MSPADPAAPEAALVRRLTAAEEVLSPGGASHDGTSMDVLEGLIDTVRRRGDTASAWLLVTAVTGALPRPELVRSVRRAIELKESEDAAMWLLDAAAGHAMRHGNVQASLRVVTDRPLVDVNFTAKTDFLTGIQRVVRRVVTEWHDRHEVEFVVVTGRGGAYRSLAPAELARLLEQEPTDEDPGHAGDGQEIVVPWGVPLVLTEVPLAAMSDRLAAVAELTDVSVRLVGYDCIPVSSAEMVPLVEPDKFGRYLELVKHSDRVAAISRTAAAEFAGFGRALRAQGLAGPAVTACPLPNTTAMPAPTVPEPPPERPLVVCVGSVGRRKNQSALVEAAEVLWREGLDFELRLFGHLAPERDPLARLAPELQDRGRPLVIESGVSDARIAGALDHARCLVFPSLHEGFGLPVVEALSHGVPVITSDFGSMRELAEGQGGVLVDPEDVGAVAAALRSVLTDDARHAALVAEARSRPVRTWTEYATDLWTELVS